MWYIYYQLLPAYVKANCDLQLTPRIVYKAHFTLSEHAENDISAFSCP